MFRISVMISGAPNNCVSGAGCMHSQCSTMDPWFAVDLGAVRSFTHLVLLNRESWGQYADIYKIILAYTLNTSDYEMTLM